MKTKLILVFTITVIALCIGFTSLVSAETAEEWNNKGYALYESGKYEEAIAAYNEAIKIDPVFKAAWYNKGLALYKLGRYDEAVAAYDEVIRIDPNFKDVLANRELARSKLLQQRAPAPSVTIIPIGGIVGVVLAIVLSIGIIALWRFKRRGVKEEIDSGITIKRGYVTLQNNEIKFRMKVLNDTPYTASKVEVMLDYPEEVLLLKEPDSKVISLGSIFPGSSRTAEYILAPSGCVHREEINALVTYRDATGNKHNVPMKPKEIHCVCPFLREKVISEGEYSRLAEKSEYAQEGISFRGISVEELAKLVRETCRNMLYKVGEHDVEGKKILFFSGESIGEKAYYLLTVIVQAHDDLTQIVLEVHSDKKYGLAGFVSEVVGSIRNLVSSIQSAKEIERIEYKQVINIIDSVVQRTSFGGIGKGTGTGATSVNIEGSVVQRTEIGLARKCPSCGKEMQGDEKFCLECGARVE